MGVDLRLTPGSHCKYLKWLQAEKLICDRCGKEIHPGDVVHRNGRVYGVKNYGDKHVIPLGSCRFWHLSCYEELLI